MLLAAASIHRLIVLASPGHDYTFKKKIRDNHKASRIFFISLLTYILVFLFASITSAIILPNESFPERNSRRILLKSSSFRF